MDKETIIRVVDKITRGGAIETEEVINLFAEYCCKEHNKDVELTKHFIKILLSIGIIGTYFTEIVEYYKRKLNIVEIKDSNNKTILVY